MKNKATRFFGELKQLSDGTFKVVWVDRYTKINQFRTKWNWERKGCLQNLNSMCNYFRRDFGFAVPVLRRPNCQHMELAARLEPLQFSKRRKPALYTR